MEKKGYLSWTISDAFWEKIENQVPHPKRDLKREYKRKPGGGRKPLEPRRVLERILCALRNGCLWKAIPHEYGAASSILKSCILEENRVDTD